MIKIYKFYTDKCSPCKTLDDILKTDDYSIFDVVSVNIKENLELKERFNIRGVPAIVQIKDEKEISRACGWPECKYFLDILIKEPDKIINREYLFSYGILKSLNK